jgi:hypothetical protein
MKPAEIFGIVVRVFGLSLLFYALWYLVYGVSSIVGAVAGCAESYQAAYFISGFFFLIVAVYLLRGAPQIVRFAYPPERKPTTSEPRAGE